MAVVVVVHSYLRLLHSHHRATARLFKRAFDELRETTSIILYYYEIVEIGVRLDAVMIS